MRQTGDFGREHVNRRKTPSPTLTGDYRGFSDRPWDKSCLAAYAQFQTLKPQIEAHQNGHLFRLMLPARAIVDGNA